MHMSSLICRLVFPLLPLPIHAVHNFGELGATLRCMLYCVQFSILEAACLFLEWWEYPFFPLKFIPQSCINSPCERWALWLWGRVLFCISQGCVNYDFHHRGLCRPYAELKQILHALTYKLKPWARLNTFLGMRNKFSWMFWRKHFPPKFSISS